MLIAILVLLGMAGAIWYFASKQTQTVSLTAKQTAELNRQIERDATLAAAAVEPTSSISSPSVEQIDSVLATDPVFETFVPTDDSAFTTPEVVAEKKATQDLQDDLAKAYELAAEEIKASAVKTPDVEVKPKKKYRYYPKKK
jgi:PBP1b-binding outer membrane lipoprotein LpoB